MLTSYLDAAMHRARFEFIRKESVHFARIPGFPGLWASGLTRRACATELRERLEDWIVLSLRLNMSLPVVGRISLAMNGSA